MTQCFGSPKLLAHASPASAGTPELLYAVPATDDLLIDSVTMINNHSGGSVVMEMFVDESGGTTYDSTTQRAKHLLVKDESLGFESQRGIFVPAGSNIAMEAAQTAVVFILHGALQPKHPA